MIWISLRMISVKVTHYERKIQALEDSCESWEQKFEESEQKRKAMRAEFDDHLIEHDQEGL